MIVFIKNERRYCDLITVGYQREAVSLREGIFDPHKSIRIPSAIIGFEVGEVVDRIHPDVVNCHPDSVHGCIGDVIETYCHRLARVFA